MDSDSTYYFGDGLTGPASHWTPHIEAITAAHAAPHGLDAGRWPDIRLTALRAVAALAAAAALMVPLVPRFESASAVATARPADTWTVTASAIHA